MSVFYKDMNIEKKVDDYKTEASLDNEIKILCKKVNINEEDIRGKTTMLYDTIDELNNCKSCPGLYSCKNKVNGHVFFPEKKESKVIFSYIPCHYKKEENILMKEKKDNENNASIKDIKVTVNRKELLKRIKEIFTSYNKNVFIKGIYLHGNFGTGKSFIIEALINELKNKFNIRAEMVYVPGMLREMKENLSLVPDKINYLENLDILVLDDIGAEKVTEWGRDEILGTILQTRMNKKLVTFFTSNLNLDELLKHLSLTKDSEDLVKAKRILERIKFLTDDYELLGNNYRNKKDE